MRIAKTDYEKTAYHFSFSQFAFRLSQFVFSPFAIRLSQFVFALPEPILRAQGRLS
jgi:hypothetical protein